MLSYPGLQLLSLQSPAATLTTMELYIWASPIEGLVSIDYHCIAAVAYLQITAKGHFSIVPCTTPGLSPTGQLPFLKDGSEWIGGLPSIIRYHQKHGHDADAGLEANQRAISSAYTSLVYDRLCDVIVSPCIIPETLLMTVLRTLCRPSELHQRYSTRFFQNPWVPIQLYHSSPESQGGSCKAR